MNTSYLIYIRGWINMATAIKTHSVKKWYDKDWEEVKGITWIDVFSFKEPWLYICIISLLVTIVAEVFMLFYLNARI